MSEINRVVIGVVGRCIPDWGVAGSACFGFERYHTRERLIELLGSPATHKQLVVLEGGHFPHDIRGLVRHTLDWFDQHLGPGSLIVEPIAPNRQRPFDGFPMCRGSSA